MRSILLAGGLLACFVGRADAQLPVMLEVNGTTTPHPTIESALEAVPHDPNTWELTSPTTITVPAGTYKPNPESTWKEGSLVIRYRGTREKTLQIFAAAGARPIIEVGHQTFLHEVDVTHQQAGIVFVGAAYCHLRGFEIDGEVTSSAPANYRKGGVFIQPSWGAATGEPSNTRLPSHHIIVEDCDVHHCSRAGVSIQMSHDCAVINCDSHHNTDELTPIRGNHSDGFQVLSTVDWDSNLLTATLPSQGGQPRSIAIHSSGNKFFGCRAWRNSDDGFDTWRNDSVTVIGCESWENGFPSFSASLPVGWMGDGEGFKFGPGSSGHVAKNCIA